MPCYNKSSSAPYDTTGRGSTYHIINWSVIQNNKPVELSQAITPVLHFELKSFFHQVIVNKPVIMTVINVHGRENIK